MTPPLFPVCTTTSGARIRPGCGPEGRQPEQTHGALFPAARRSVRPALLDTAAVRRGGHCHRRPAHLCTGAASQLTQSGPARIVLCCRPLTEPVPASYRTESPSIAFAGHDRQMVLDARHPPARRRGLDEALRSLGGSGPARKRHRQGPGTMPAHIATVLLQQPARSLPDCGRSSESSTCVVAPAGDSHCEP